MNEIEKLNALAAILDKHREVSIQEAVYRLLSLNMTKSSVKVKYLSTIHPSCRDGLLKGKIEELSENDFSLRIVELPLDYSTYITSNMSQCVI